MSSVRLPRKKFYGPFVSTGWIAAFLSVRPKTVIGWIDQGRLKCVRLPGGRRERRVHRDALRAFLTDNGFPDALVEFTKWEEANPWP